MFHSNSSGLRDARIFDLALRRSQTPVLMLNWVFEHVIDEQSPLFDLYDGKCLKEEITFYATVLALDGTVYQSVYRNQIYRTNEIECNHRFVDMIDSDGEVATMWADRLHQTLPIGE